jgi:hypothetical protein
MRSPPRFDRPVPGRSRSLLCGRRESVLTRPRARSAGPSEVPRLGVEIGWDAERCTRRPQIARRLRTARRWPPKRCRMIGLGAPIARPVVRDPGCFQTQDMRRSRGVREPGGLVGHGRDDLDRFWRRPTVREQPGAWSTGSERPRSPTSRHSSHSAAIAWVTGRHARRRHPPPAHLPAVPPSGRRSPTGPRVRRGAISSPQSGRRHVGTIDLLVVDPASEPDAVSASLIEECLRSAANKGCASVEAPQPDDPAEHPRWERQGFVDGQPGLRRDVDPAGRRR